MGEKMKDLDGPKALGICIAACKKSWTVGESM